MVQGNLGHTKHGLKVIFKSVSLWLSTGWSRWNIWQKRMLTWNYTMTITSVNNASVTTIKKWRHQMNMRQKIMSLTNKKFAPFNQWTSPFQKGKFIDLRDILINHVNSLSCKDEISRYYYCHKLKYNNLCLTNISRRMNWGTKLYLGRPNAIKNSKPSSWQRIKLK